MKKMKQIDGKLAPKDEENIDPLASPKEAIKRAKTLDQLLGYSGLSRYGTTDEQAYKNQLENMNKSDLQKHAINIGLIPVDNRTTLVARLMKEFKKYIAACNPPISNSSVKQKQVTDKAMNILAEGR